LLLLPDAFSTTADSTARPLLKTAMAMLLPAHIAFECPDALKAQAVMSFVARTQAECDLDFYIKMADVLAEINRRLQPSAELQFRPIFHRHYASLYPELVQAFPSCVEASIMRQLVSTFMIAIDVQVNITHPIVRDVCSIIARFVPNLDREAPQSTTALARMTRV
jgi:hypothetical protein